MARYGSNRGHDSLVCLAVGEDGVRLGGGGVMDDREVVIVQRPVRGQAGDQVPEGFADVRHGGSSQALRGVASVSVTSARNVNRPPSMPVSAYSTSPSDQPCSTHSST